MGFFDFFSADKTPVEPPEYQLFATVHGRVQGVGFRWWVAGTAKPLGLVGYAKNLDDGTVEVLAQGSKAACQNLYAALTSGDTAGHVEHVDHEFSEPVGSYKGFGMY